MPLRINLHVSKFFKKKLQILHTYMFYILLKKVGRNFKFNVSRYVCFNNFFLYVGSTTLDYDAKGIVAKFLYSD